MFEVAVVLYCKVVNNTDEVLI